MIRQAGFYAYHRLLPVATLSILDNVEWYYNEQSAGLLTVS